MSSQGTQDDHKITNSRPMTVDYSSIIQNDTPTAAAGSSMKFFSVKDNDEVQQKDDQQNAPAAHTGDGSSKIVLMNQ